MICPYSIRAFVLGKMITSCKLNIDLFPPILPPTDGSEETNKLS